jgi:hypothetical protein
MCMGCLPDLIPRHFGIKFHDLIRDEMVKVASLYSKARKNTESAVGVGAR